MKKAPDYRPFFIAIFVLALALRLGLALVNRQANDDHMEEVRMIMKTGQLPIMPECRECFHPKLFYVSAAALLQIFSINNPDSQTIFIQLVNAASGAITLAVLWKFISEYPSENEKLKLMAFALTALNPKLTAIHAQASNDSFVILFGALALFFAYRFFQKPGRVPFGLLTLFSLLAVTTKVTGWLAVLAIFLSLFVAAWTQKSKKALLYAPVFLITVLILTTLNPLSQFVTNYQHFGSPLANSSQQLPLPALFQQTINYRDHYYRPGIVSIQDGYLTFKLIDLLKYPLTTNEQYKFPPHRTSFWTMLYADAHSLHFQNWPSSWQSKDDQNFTISRVIFVLALLPTFAILAGFAMELAAFLKNLLNRRQPEIRALFLLTFGGCMALLLLTSLLYRDFAFIKLIYILPGLLAFPWLFLRGAEKLLNHWLPYAAMLALLVFYSLDAVSMITQLAQAG